MPLWASRTGAAVLVGQAAPGVIAIAATPAIIANAGVEAFGLYSLVLSSQVIVAISDLGAANTLLTEVPKALEAEDHERAAVVVRHALRLSSRMAAALACTAALALAVPVPWASFTGIPSALEGTTSRAFGALLLCTALNVVGAVFFKLRQAEGRAAGAFIFQGVGALTGGLLTIIGAQHGLGVASLVLCTLAPPALARLLLASRTDLLVSPPAAPTRQDGLNQRAAFFAYMQLAAVLAYQIDQLLLGALSDLHQVARYSLVARPIGVGLLVMGVVSTLLWPYLSAAVARHDSLAIRRVMRESFSLLSAVSLAVGLTCLLFGEPIWRILSGDQITPTFALVAGFTIMLVLRGIDSVTATFLNSIPVVAFQVRTATMVLVGNVAVTTVLILHYGAAGAVWGTVLTQAPIVTVPYLLRGRAELRKIDVRSREIAATEGQN